MGIRPTTIAALALSIAIASACGKASNPPPPGSGAVARIVTVGPISKKTFEHWYRVVARTSSSRNGRSAPQPPPPSGSDAGKGFRKQAMELLITGAWTEGEAAERHVKARPAEVRRQYRQTRQAFSSQEKYGKYLKATGQTKADILYRARTSVLSSAIRAQAMKRASKPADQQKALSRFVKAYTAKWKARTSCADGYVVPSCAQSR